MIRPPNGIKRIPPIHVIPKFLACLTGSETRAQMRLLCDKFFCYHSKWSEEYPTFMAAIETIAIGHWSIDAFRKSLELYYDTNLLVEELMSKHEKESVSFSEKTRIAFKRDLADRILNLLKEGEYIFGGAVRDLILNGSYGSANDFDVKFNSTESFEQFKKALKNIYPQVGVLEDHKGYLLPKFFKKTKLLVYCDGIPVNIDCIVNTSDMPELSPINTETLDADVNALYTNKSGKVESLIPGIKARDICARIREKKYIEFNMPGWRVSKLEKLGFTNVIATHKPSNVESVDAPPIVTKKSNDGPAVEIPSGTKQWYMSVSETIKEIPIESQESKMSDKQTGSDEAGLSYKEKAKAKAKKIGKNIAVRTTAEQTTLAAQALAVAALRSTNDPNTVAIATFLESPLGKSLIQGGLFAGLTFLPGISDNPKAELMAEEYATAGGTNALNTFLAPLIPALTALFQNAFKSIPDEFVADDASAGAPAKAIRVAEKKQSHLVEEESDEEETAHVPQKLAQVATR